MDFFRTASSPPCRCLPRHPLSGSVHDVLRARATPGEGPKKKFNPQFVGLAACLIAISSTFSRFILFFSSGFVFRQSVPVCRIVAFHFCLSVIFEASSWLIRVRRSLIFRRFCSSSFFFPRHGTVAARE